MLAPVGYATFFTQPIHNFRLYLSCQTCFSHLYSHSSWYINWGHVTGLNLIGGDVVEVSPPFDPTGNAALVGATMLYEIACVLADAVARELSSQENV